MTNRIQVGNLSVAECLYELVNEQIIPGTDIESDKFWADFEAILTDLAPKNKALLAKRATIQKQMDEWYQNNASYDMDSYNEAVDSNGQVQPKYIGMFVQTGPGKGQIR